MARPAAQLDQCNDSTRPSARPDDRYWFQMTLGLSRALRLARLSRIRRDIVDVILEATRPRGKGGEWTSAPIGHGRFVEEIGSPSTTIIRELHFLERAGIVLAQRQPSGNGHKQTRYLVEAKPSRWDWQTVTARKNETTQFSKLRTIAGKNETTGIPLLKKHPKRKREDGTNDPGTSGLGVPVADGPTQQGETSRGESRNCDIGEQPQGPTQHDDPEVSSRVPGTAPSRAADATPPTAAPLDPGPYLRDLVDRLRRGDVSGDEFTADPAWQALPAEGVSQILDADLLAWLFPLNAAA